MKFFYLAIILLINFHILAQENEKKIENEISQLTKLNKKPKKTEQNIARMLELSKEVYSQEPDLVLSCLEKLKPVIEEKKYYHGWQDYCYLIQKIYTGKGEFKKAEEMITRIYERYANKFTQDEEVSIRLNLAMIANRLGEIGRSQSIIEEILPKAQTDSRKASLYYQRSMNYQNSGDYEKAIKDALAAVELYKSIESWKNVAVTYDLLGIIYYSIGDYEKALFYARKGLEVAKSSNNYEGEMGISFNIGIYHKNLMQIDSALYYYDLSRKLIEKYGNVQALAQNLLAVGELYSKELHNYAEADKYLKKSLGIFYTSGVQYGICLNWSSLAANNQRAKKYAGAKLAYDSAMVYARKLKIPTVEEEVQKGYYELYKETGSYEKALAHYERLNDINREINLEQSKKEIAKIQAKYDVAVKDREIERISNEYRIQKFRNGILLLIILGAGSVIYFLVYRNRSLRKLYQRNVELSNSPLLFEVPEDTEEADPLEKIFRELVHLMQNEKIYIEPNLSVDHIAKKLNTNQKYLSNSITKYAGMNFNNFINSYRIHEAKRMMLRQPKLPIKEVMYVCGFNSKTPFYLAFQKYTGLSPQQFKDLSVSQNKKQAEEQLIEA